MKSIKIFFHAIYIFLRLKICRSDLVLEIFCTEFKTQSRTRIISNKSNMIHYTRQRHWMHEQIFGDDKGFEGGCAHVLARSCYCKPYYGLLGNLIRMLIWDSHSGYIISRIIKAKDFKA